MRVTGALSIKEALEILDVERGAKYGEIKSAFKRMALKLHPDVGGDIEDYLQLVAAYELAIQTFVKGRDLAGDEAPVDIEVRLGSRFDVLSVRIGDKVVTRSMSASLVLDGPDIVIQIDLATPISGAGGTGDDVEALLQLKGTRYEAHYVRPIRSASYDRSGRLAMLTFSPV